MDEREQALPNDARSERAGVDPVRAMRDLALLSPGVFLALWALRPAVDHLIFREPLRWDQHGGALGGIWVLAYFFVTNSSACRSENEVRTTTRWFFASLVMIGLTTGAVTIILGKGWSDALGTGLILGLVGLLGFAVARHRWIRREKI